ncbi:tetratricopeptide repeat protein [Flavobacterium ginsenosidimutans]|uniref:tetratricopeptide repeat protein n=1 Tax=Flavobacterium ginsenosidimutans TaxID=687844 RepID=UPI003D99F02C
MKHYYLLFAVIFVFGCKNKDAETESIKVTSPKGCYTPKTTDKDWYSLNQKAPKFKGLDGIDFKITTNSKEAQQYFNQGMMLAYGFNHAEAARSFFEASRLDPKCAMAYWGFAYVLGPNYNAGMEEDNFQRSYDAVQKAKSLSANSSPKEKALIDALTTRYASKPPADRRSLDIAYAAAMKKVYTQFSSDPDIGALYAESLMNLHPWDLYDKNTGAIKEWTPEIVKVLEALMVKNPKHPGAHHFYIHAVESSATPEKAMKSAKLLESLVPGAGHLLHMPSHIYIRTGDYHEGSLSNIEAAKVDSLYTTTCHAQGAYPLAYYPHNYHFLTATAALEGNSKLAWNTAKVLQEHTSVEIMRQPGWGTLQHYYTIPYYIAVKFAMWDTIISLPKPDKDLIYPQLVWHYARGMAYLGKNNLTEAQNELSALNKLSKDSSLKDITVWNINKITDLADIASKVLAGNIAFKRNDLPKSVSLLTEAVALEDRLNYNEPPDWFFSIRHYLGAVLLKAGKYAEAEKIYRRDLQIWPKNGWALVGLYNSLIQQKKGKEALQTKNAFEESWKYADFKIVSSSALN